MPEGLKNISTESHNEAGLLFTSNKTELSPTSVPETGSNGLSSYFWKDKQSAHKLAQKRASCPSPPTDRGQQSSKSLNGPRTVKKSVASAECAVPSRVSKNGHCVFVYPVVESLSPTMSCSKPLNGQYSGRPPDKNCAVQSGQSKKKSHKRASSVDLSPRKGDKSVSFWWKLFFSYSFSFGINTLESKIKFYSMFCKIFEILLFVFFCTVTVYCLWNISIFIIVRKLWGFTKVFSLSYCQVMVLFFCVLCLQEMKINLGACKHNTHYWFSIVINS